jgi:hypothetical protein
MGKLRALFLVVAACGSPASEPQPSDAGDPGSPAAPRQDGSWVVTSVDDRGAPRFLWATASDAVNLAPTDAAREHLGRTAGAYAITPEALATLKPARTIDVRSGAAVTTFRHEIGGIEVYGSDVNVMLRRDGTLVAIAGAPHPAAVPTLALPFTVTAETAIAAAVQSVTGTRGTATDRRVPSGRWATYDLQHPDVLAADPIRARRVYFAQGDQLRPAYAVELVLAANGSTNVRASQRIIAADTGDVLQAIELTASESFSYRVWADAARRPNSDPFTDMAPHPTGNPDGTQPDPTAPALIAMESFNTPPGGGIDPWLAAAATSTQGNNVDAYTDRFAPDGFTAGSDFRATATSLRTFDRTYDLTASPLANQTQTMASIAHAFYITNWLHDYYYDSGFDENAGNAQQNNFGRGGAGNDRMLVEIQDNADTERDNANMSTPGDGTSPRMQVYLWTAQETRFVRLTPGGDQLAGSAQFGPQTFDVTNTVVLVVDQTAPTSDACNTIVNGAQLSGRIALIDRGTCNFIDKARAAQGRGAVGVIIADNVVAASPPAMAGSGGQPITIPTLSITKAAGDALKASLGNGAVTARLFRSGGPLRDGALDSTVVAHEWGHYLHHRLVGGCSNLQCNALSEGWGDFVGLHMMIRQGDSLTGTYALAGHAFATDPNSWYFGIRRTPYTTDPTKNPLTFRHLGQSQTLPPGPAYNIFTTDNAEVHNAGEIWAQMMFEAYARMLANPGARTFDQVQRDMADYVVAGLALTPVDATYTEQRDAVLAAAAASSTADFTQIAQGFATRGAGTCAVGAARNSTTLDGIVESFTLAPVAGIGNVTLDDATRSCDDDGFLDAQERGRISIQVTNVGAAPLTDGQIQVSTTTAGVTFPAGTTKVVPTVAPMASVIVTIPIALAATFPDQGSVQLAIAVNSAATCDPTASKTVLLEANRDEVPNASTIDTVESVVPAWTATGAAAASVWSRVTESATQHDWQGVDLARASDTQLVSPALVVGSAPLTMTFRHRHQFEFSAGQNFDGGVLEVSQDGGATFVDAATLGTVPYTGTIATGSGNPLGGRQGFVRATAGFPAFTTATVSFGTALANRTILVRFRIGTDEAVGDLGWTIDDISFTGITNKPFRSVVNDTAVCQPPIANAGPDQTVAASSLVTLDGSASSDPNNDPLTFTWTQLQGPAVTLSSTTAAKPTFTAPSAATSLQFRLRVSDGSATAADTVTITVVGGTPPDAGTPDAALPDAAVDAGVVDAAPPDAAPDAALDAGVEPDAALDAGTEPDAAQPPVDASTPPPPPPGGDDGGCCSTSGGRSPSQHLPIILVVGALFLRRRLRLRR